jgi:hypothetical protein
MNRERICKHGMDKKKSILSPLKEIRPDLLRLSWLGEQTVSEHTF